MRRLREARGWSQAQLARAARISQQTVAALESGEQRSSKRLPKIAAALDVDIGDLDPDYLNRPPERDRGGAQRGRQGRNAQIDPERLERFLTALLEALGRPDAQSRRLARAFVKALRSLESPSTAEPDACCSISLAS